MASTATIAGPTGAPATFGGVPFSSLPAGNQAAILAAQGSNPTGGQPAASAGPSNSDAALNASASGMAGSSGGLPPLNDIVNAGINLGGLAAPIGFGTIASMLKGFFQQAFSGTEANTNHMSEAESALYGPGLGERFANWISGLFDGSISADSNPQGPPGSFTNESSSGGPNDIGQTGHAPSSFFSDPIGSLESAVNGMFGGNSGGSSGITSSLPSTGFGDQGPGTGGEVTGPDVGEASKIGGM